LSFNSVPAWFGPLIGRLQSLFREEFQPVSGDSLDLVRGLLPM